MSNDYEDDDDAPDWEAKYNELSHKFEGMDEKFSSFQSQQEELEQNQMLDSVMDDLHNRHGDFNEQWILVQIANGSSPDEAVESWNDLQQSIVDSRTSNPPPPLMGGPGGTPLDQVDKTKLRDPNARKAYGAALLQAQLGRG